MFSPNQKRTPEDPISSLLTPLWTPVPKNGKLCPDFSRSTVVLSEDFTGCYHFFGRGMHILGLFCIGCVVFVVMFCFWFVLDMPNDVWSSPWQVRVTCGLPWFTHQMIFEYKSRIIDFFWDFWVKKHIPSNNCATISSDICKIQFHWPGQLPAAESPEKPPRKDKSARGKDKCPRAERNSQCTFAGRRPPKNADGARFFFSLKESYLKVKEVNPSSTQTDYWTFMMKQLKGKDKTEVNIAEASTPSMHYSHSTQDFVGVMKDTPENYRLEPTNHPI